ncbi:ABC transporter ATP-binding protein [Belnapia rosea]|uniref:Amino acid/amide ABC transporter ATP-binding protein 1, HAAT family n=1 Tax=Belnapia rosea TaxID=938405 RepID=A0A1G7A0S4_9PROT|nr:ABC transporter ATP-binding protein [Belnapia rosea]SDB69429.1 branched-chain amino acid transport system ATP-binding protein [Belnapia rosea]SDE08514.1 amino acid/amide ABC transporter ATP-binding protein 1, HAAT family [Belnapia rosea]
MSEVLLSARGLRLAFGGVKAADGIDLDVRHGEFLAIIGPNGAGKTTFINMTTGYLRPQAGRIEFEGKPILGLSPRAIVRRGIGRSFQLPQLFTEHTVLENAALAIAARRGIWSPLAPLLRPRWRDEAMDLLDRFGLRAVAEARADALNEGARKLADIAMAVALEPSLLLMDEPTSGVAAAEKMAIVETLVRVLRSTGVTAVFVEHDMDVVARFADRVAVWSQGRIAALGPPAEVLADPAVRRDVIGIAADA